MPGHPGPTKGAVPAALSTHFHTSNILQESPEGSPHDSARSSRPPKRGSTTSPGQEALSKAAHWLALLVCCHVKAGLAPDGLVLINDLVQLLYYHGSNVAQDSEDEQTDETIHLLSPLVQASQAASAQLFWAELWQQHHTVCLY